MTIKTTSRILAGMFMSLLCVVALPKPVLAVLEAYEPFDYVTTIPNGTLSTALGLSLIHI